MMTVNFNRHFLQIMILFVFFVLFSCSQTGSKGISNDAEQQSTENSDEDVHPENGHEPISAPSFDTEYLEGLNKLVAAEKWVTKEDPANYFMIELDENGFYRVNGLLPNKNSYINKLSTPDPEAGNWLVEFRNNDNDITDCYEFGIFDGRIYLTVYEQCTKPSSTRVQYVNQARLVEIEQEAFLMEEMTLKFTFVGIVSGDLWITMEDEEGNSKAFSGIDIRGFDFTNNAYFEVDPEFEGSAIPQYRLKDGVTDQWLTVSFMTEEIDIGNEEPESANIIKGVTVKM